MIFKLEKLGYQKRVEESYKSVRIIKNNLN